MDRLTTDQKSQIIYESARECDLDGHVVIAEKRSQLYTAAEKAMGWLNFYKNIPHKNSYLYFDSVDACFYISNNNQACVTFAARWLAGSEDLSSEKMERALIIINKMLETMQAKINDALEEREDENN